jgi:FlaA1/EpsC-like NDP-sugar epimerase
VERFVFVSTDKTVCPSDVMGASKRVAEMLVQGPEWVRSDSSKVHDCPLWQHCGKYRECFPLFKKQIQKGGPVTVTHPEVTRFFMTIPESCQLILQAGTVGKGEKYSSWTWALY